MVEFSLYARNPYKASIFKFIVSISCLVLVPEDFFFIWCDSESTCKSFIYLLFTRTFVGFNIFDPVPYGLSS